MNNVLFSMFEALILFPEIQLNVFTDLQIKNKRINDFPKAKNIKIFDQIDLNIISNSDCIMTDVYNSMNDNPSENKSINLKRFQVNKELISYTKNDCVFMHCLPAKINSEVTQEVLSSDISIIFKQAKNRLIAQRGILKWLEI